MSPMDSRKQSIYLTRELLRELHAEADRLDRSLSWCISWAIRHGGLASLRRIPSLEEVSG
jgi:uncharacterized small protein (TIGR04563 family)